MPTSSGTIPSENRPIFPALKPGKTAKKEDFYENRTYQKQRVTEVYNNAKDPTEEIYTHDTKLKKRLLEYAAKFPDCANRPAMTSKAASGLKSIKPGSVFD